MFKKLTVGNPLIKMADEVPSLYHSSSVVIMHWSTMMDTMIGNILRFLLSVQYAFVLRALIFDNVLYANRNISKNSKPIHLIETYTLKCKSQTV